MAMLPEEFPVVLTVFLALGAWRLSQRHVLTRRMPAIETLGSATVLCVDKTGTLTQNRMTVRDLMVGDAARTVDDGPLPEEFHEIVEFAVLASPVDPFDPMDTAFKELGQRYLADTEHLHADWTLVREYPLSEHLLALSHVWRSPDGSDYVIAAKGAPEAIADLCHLDARPVRRAWTAVWRRWPTAACGCSASRGRRSGVSDGLPAEQHDFDFEFIGLVGLQDPIRAGVPRRRRRKRTPPGIRVVMITGDYPGTATSIAREIGLDAADDVITGPELDAMSDEQLAARIGDVCIFARMVPEQKLRIVQALKARGEVVAMTGDGVNDAPALKAADIGIAMGQRGTDVAREAAALVLTDDDFSSIVGAVRQGRRAYDNLRRRWPTSSPCTCRSPACRCSRCSSGAWAGRSSCCRCTSRSSSSSSTRRARSSSRPRTRSRASWSRPPRPVDEPLFAGRVLAISLLQGAGGVGGVLRGLLLGVLCRDSEPDVRALTFATLVIGNLGLILVNRSWTQTVFAGLSRTATRRLGGS